MRLRHLQTCLSVGAKAALAGALLCGVTACERAKSDNPASRQDEGVPVRTALVQPGTLRETVRGIGTLRAAETVEIKPEIDGIIREIHFEEGGAIEKDQLLFSIDDEKLKHQLASRRAALAAARVQLANAQRILKRVQVLTERSAADRDEFDQAQTDFRAADAEVDRMEAEVEWVQARLDDTRLRAPFDGVISECGVDVGDYVQAGDDLTTLYRISQMEIAFTLPERFMGQVRPPQAVAVRVSAYPDRDFNGQVYFVSPEVDESTRDFLVKATVKNPEGLLKPGAFGTAVVTLEVRERRAVIPEEALVATRGGYIIFVVEDQTARRREVRIGLRETGLVEIVEGIEPGERVVRAGHMNLSDGVRVRVVQGNDEQSKQAERSDVEPD
ncbi:MAG: efflux RND transporter periplasmic adaptor subunit [Phycisphaerae bacterium]